MTTQQTTWESIFLLPNLGLSKSIGNEHIAIVPHTDPRVVEICASNKFTRSLVGNFEDQFRRKRYPALLLINNNATINVRKIDTIIGFRNIIALTCIIKSHETSLQSISSIILPYYSDYFDFYPITISGNNNGYLTESPALFGFDNADQNFRGQTIHLLLLILVKLRQARINNCLKCWNMFGKGVLSEEKSVNGKHVLFLDR